MYKRIEMFEMSHVTSNEIYDVTSNSLTLDAISDGSHKVKQDLGELFAAICMTLAYMVFISTAIMLARFFRGHWATKTPGGLKLWFHVSVCCFLYREDNFYYYIIDLILLIPQLKLLPVDCYVCVTHSLENKREFTINLSQASKLAYSAHRKCTGDVVK